MIIIAFPSAISRYLVSNIKSTPKLALRSCFHPLYRGTWFPTKECTPAVKVEDGFHPLYRGTWFPTTQKTFPCLTNSCFHPLYRGTWFPTRCSPRNIVAHCSVSIRYIAVLGFQQERISRMILNFCFHPLYRGTWFPTPRKSTRRFARRTGFHPLYRGTWFPTFSYGLLAHNSKVSIRYIAVLGFQPERFCHDSY